MRTIIAGSRTITNAAVVEQAITEAPFWPKITEVLCGGAQGVDTLGANWAKHRGITISHYPAKWDEYGPSAGPIRNREMAQNADALILVWDGKSRGSRSMLSYARSSGLKIFEWVVK